MIVVRETRTIGGWQLKWSYLTRVIPDGAVVGIGSNSRKPEAGDVVVARVHQIGAHDDIEDPLGRARKLYEGDFIIGAYGNRYATDFYEGYVPEGQQTHLLTSGGLIGTVESAHDAVDEPTKLEIVGALVDEQRAPITLSTFAHPFPPPSVPCLGTIVVVGSGMNSGKTTTVASIAQGLSRGQPRRRFPRLWHAVHFRLSPRAAKVHDACHLSRTGRRWGGCRGAGDR